MRTAIALLLLTGCGSTQSASCPPDQRISYGRCVALPPAYDAYVPAEEAEFVPIDGPPADADLAFLIEPPPDAAPADAMANIPVSVPEEEVASPFAATGTTDENGVHVAFVAFKHWCALGRKRGEICSFERKECQRITGARCKEVKNVACFVFANLTTGDERPLCVSSYGECLQYQRDGRRSGDYDVGECFVLRYRPKEK